MNAAKQWDNIDCVAIDQVPVSSELTPPAQAVGKPIWWIQGEYQNRKLEIIIDGLNGNHYVFTA